MVDLPDPIAFARELLDASPDAPANQTIVDQWTGEETADPVVDITLEQVEVRVVHTWVVTNASGARRRWAVAHDGITGDVLRSSWEGLPPA